VTLLAFAADRRRAGVDKDRKARAAIDRSISPARRAHSSKPAASRCCGARWDRLSNTGSLH